MSPASERNAGDEGPGAGAGQVDAALAARARLERLLAAPTPFRADTGEADPAVTAVLESTDRPRHEYLDEGGDGLTRHCARDRPRPARRARRAPGGFRCRALDAAGSGP